MKKSAQLISMILILSTFVGCGSSKEQVETENNAELEQTKPMSKQSIYSIPINSLSGDSIDLTSYKGKKILFVNVASECGFTPQYADLEKLYEQYSDKLMVIGVPCNQFGAQEPGTHEEIATFCQKNYGVTFLLTEKVDVKGDNQHPLYKWLTDKEMNGVENSSVKWNFHKYLIDEEGSLLESFGSAVNPLDEKITKYL